jgi:hypothetical protein
VCITSPPASQSSRAFCCLTVLASVHYIIAVSASSVYFVCQFPPATRLLHRRYSHKQTCHRSYKKKFRLLLPSNFKRLDQNRFSTHTRHEQFNHSEERIRSSSGCKRTYVTLVQHTNRTKPHHDHLSDHIIQLGLRDRDEMVGRHRCPRLRRRRRRV